MKNPFAPIGTFIVEHKTQILTTALITTASVAVAQTLRYNGSLETIADMTRALNDAEAFIVGKDLLTEFNDQFTLVTV